MKAKLGKKDGKEKKKLREKDNKLGKAIKYMKLVNFRLLFPNSFPVINLKNSLDIIKNLER